MFFQWSKIERAQRWGMDRIGMERRGLDWQVLEWRARDWKGKEWFMFRKIILSARHG